MPPSPSVRRETLPFWESLVVVAPILFAFAYTLHAMGRIPWCTCGIGLWTGNAWSNATSQHFSDPYSLSHVLHGLLFYAALFPLREKWPLARRFFIALFLEIGWEILENSPIIINRYRAVTASLDYFGDSILNATGDVLFMMLGFWLAARLPWRGTLALFIVIELAMLATIRDNLTLNVLMLLSPIDAIREWQVGG